MGLFEEQPLLLVPVILAVITGYDIAKWAVRLTIRNHYPGLKDSQRSDDRAPGTETRA